MTIFKYGNKSKFILVLLTITIYSFQNVFLAFIVNSFVQSSVNKNITSFLRYATIGVLGIIVFSIIGLVRVNLEIIL